VGVSTQYLVRMAWGQELQVFEQNTGRRRLFRPGDQVELSWRPEYAFLLDTSDRHRMAGHFGRVAEAAKGIDVRKLVYPRKMSVLAQVREAVLADLTE